jgi:hypothetical protein
VEVSSGCAPAGGAENDAAARQWTEDTVAGRQSKARRPPGSTRDNVARAIYTEVKESAARRTARIPDISYCPPSA